MTLIVQFYHGNHLHFVDGSNGGYTVASKQLKRRLFGVDNLYANR